MRILLVEDDTDLRTYLTSRLEEKCFAVDATGDGVQAIELSSINEYNLIVLDYSLPGKNGFEICRQIRQAGNTVPIIMISVTGDVPHKVECFDHGIDDYLTKPFYFEELYARIRAVLRRPQTIQQQVLYFDDLTLNTNTQKAMRADNLIYLTRKEYALLECLLKNPQTVVSREQILDQIWESDVDPFSNTVETHITNLRKKIHIPEARKLIHSVPGRGYKIDYEKYH